MHLGNEVLSPAVAAGFGAVSAACLVVCGRRARTRLEGRQLPLMGMMGALVFAAQMVNFQILGGSSGHLGGGAMLAIALGPEAAVFVMSAVLFIQALVFNDGGLLALGANVFNIGIVPALLGALLFRVVAGGAPGATRSAGRFYLGCFLAGFLGVAAGAVMVPLQIGLSGLLRDGVSLSWFFGTMAWVHLLIGAVEGVVTFLVLAGVHRTMPQLLPQAPNVEGRVGARAVLASLAAVVLVTGVFFSMMASGLPDGLEYVLGVEVADSGEGTARSAGGRKIVGEPGDDTLMARASEVQERIAVWPDYTRPADPAPADGEEEARGFFHWDSFRAVSAVAGAAATLLLAFLLGKLLSARARRREGAAA